MPPRSPQDPLQPNSNQPNTPQQTQTPTANTLPRFPAPSESQSTQSTVQPPPEQGMFSGRLNRLGYFMASIYIVTYFLIPVGIQLGFSHSGASTNRAAANIATLVLGVIGVIVVIPAGISINIRRWHDLNKSGWYMLLGFIPFLGYILPLVLLFMPGTKGANNYGDPDTKPAKIRKVLFNK